MTSTLVENRPAAAAPPSVALARRIALGLWFVWAALLFGGFVYGVVTSGAEVNAHIPRACRMLSSVTLVAAGIVGVMGCAATPAARYAAFIAVGMALGLLGDLFNARLIPWVLPDDPMLGGLVSFAVGHVFYIAAGLDLARRAGLFDRAKWTGAIGFWQVFALVGWFVVVYLSGPAGVLHWAALPYSLLLAGTAGVATALGLCDRRFLPLAAGGILFLASDLILAFDMFRGGFRYLSDFVWLTYGPGQMLIVYSQWPALRRLTEAR